MSLPAPHKTPWRKLKWTKFGNYHTFNDTGWLEPENPSCGICGQLIREDPKAHEFFAKVPNFTAKAGNPHHIRIDPSEIGDYLYDGDCDWRSTYRAVVSIADQGSFITGVAYRHSGFNKRGGYRIGAPRNYDDAWLIRSAIHPREQLVWFGKPSTLANEVRPENCGWPMHESCWRLMCQCFDDVRIKNNVTKFGNAIQQEYVNKVLDYNQYGEPSLRSSAWEMIKHDPFFLRDYYYLFERARHAFIRKRSNTGITVASQGFPLSEDLDYGTESFSKLSLDIALMILDHLDEADFRNMIIASGWKLPTIYWERSIPGVLFEFWEVWEPDGVDWQYLGLGFHRMMEKKDGVWHRLSIIHYMARLWYYFCHDVPDLYFRHAFIDFGLEN